jgi:hypothetical protein
MTDDTFYSLLVYTRPGYQRRAACINYAAAMTRAAIKATHNGGRNSTIRAIAIDNARFALEAMK